MLNRCWEAGKQKKIKTSVLFIIGMLKTVVKKYSVSKSEIVIWIMKDISSNIGTTEAFATKEKNGHCTNHLKLPENRQKVLDLYLIR